MALGILAKVRLYLELRCRRSFWARSSIPSRFALMVALAFVLVGVDAIARRLGVESKRIFYAIEAIVGLPALVFIQPTLWRHSRIYLIPRAQHQTWWSTNRDKLLVPIITSTMTLLIGLFLGHLWPASRAPAPAAQAASTDAGSPTTD